MLAVVLVLVVAFGSMISLSIAVAVYYFYFYERAPAPSPVFSAPQYQTIVGPTPSSGGQTGGGQTGGGQTGGGQTGGGQGGGNGQATAPSTIVNDGDFVVESGPIDKVGNPLAPFKAAAETKGKTMPHPMTTSDDPNFEQNITHVNVVRLKDGTLVGVLFTDSHPNTLAIKTEGLVEELKGLYKALRGDKKRVSEDMWNGPCPVVYLRQCRGGTGWAIIDRRFSPIASVVNSGFITEPGAAGTYEGRASHVMFHELGHNTQEYTFRQRGKWNDAIREDWGEWVCDGGSPCPTGVASETYANGFSFYFSKGFQEQMKAGGPDHPNGAVNYRHIHQFFEPATFRP